MALPLEKQQSLKRFPAIRELWDSAPVLRAWATSIVYVLVFLLLDWVSYIRPFQGLNITPWNPQPALAVALLLWNRRYVWLVWFSLLVAELAVRGVPADWFATAAATAALALSYAVIARAFQVRMSRTLALATQSDLGWLTLIVIGGALLSAVVYLGTYFVIGVGPSGHIAEAIVHYWIGDLVGLAVLLPMLLMLMDPQGRAALSSTARRRDWWLIAALIIALLLVVFVREDEDHFKFFYLLLLPVVWASARLGLSGAVLAAALTQIGLIIGVQAVTDADSTVFELQVLMAALTMTGLMLGVTVDERERAAAELKGSLRLAAAGQMAATLAHELSQPLTALNSYAQASRMLAASADISDAERIERLTGISSRMGDDALRASDVVKRLRDFFRTGSTQLQHHSVDSLLAEAAEASARRAEALGIDIQCDAGTTLPPALIDRVQIAVVLRNLLANALDAAPNSDAPARVILRASQRERSLLIEVIDSGPGVERARLQTLFDPGHSDKPGGMGVGLSICRAIVEAHGGTLWSEGGSCGHFCFTLPLDGPAPEGEGNAS